MRTMMLAGGIAASLASAASATKISDYNLFVLGDFAAQYSDTEGRVGVGGNASLTGYSVGALAASNSANLVVGGTLTTVGGSTNGKIVVGTGTPSFTWYDASGYTPGTPLPAGFAGLGAGFASLSAQLGGLAGTSVVGNGYGGFTVNAGQSGLNVYTISAAQLATSNNFTVNVGTGATALINVTGAMPSFTGGLTVNGGNANVLWNFADATSLTLYNIGMQGSVLAPRAAFTGSGQLNGDLIVGSWTRGYNNSFMQVNTGNDFNGTLTTGVPEPASWAMMVAGFGLVGGAIRRHRRAALRLA